MKFKIEEWCNRDTLISFAIPPFRECFLRPPFFLFPFCSFPRSTHSLIPLPVAGDKLLTSLIYISMAPRREIREIWGPDIACVYSPPLLPSVSLLPSCTSSTKILRGLSAYAFVTCVSHCRRRRRRRCRGPPMLDGETKSITTQASRERGTVLLNQDLLRVLETYIFRTRKYLLSFSLFSFRYFSIIVIYTHAILDINF